ncbi:hypothetical protein Trydic_g3589 [Trypoxylus dichotomus]
MIVQKIHERDVDQRRVFCERMLDLLLMMSDEAHLYLDGYVNKTKPFLLGSRQPRRIAPKATAGWKNDHVVCYAFLFAAAI